MSINEENITAEWTELDEMGTKKKVTVIDRGDEVEIHTFFPEPGISNKVTVSDSEQLGKELREM